MAPLMAALMPSPIASNGWLAEPSSLGSLTVGSPGPASPGASSSTYHVIWAGAAGTRSKGPLNNARSTRALNRANSRVSMGCASFAGGHLLALTSWSGDVSGAQQAPTLVV